MIGFLEPLALVGLAAAAIPTLLHLIGRRLPPTVVFPAVRYLTATEREHSRRLRLRNLLLLVLRTAIVVLVALAAARPVARVAGGGGHPPTAVALIVDNSLSSGAVVSGRRVLDVLAERAGQVLARLDGGDQLWLVLADGVPHRTLLADARAIVDSLSPWPLRLDLARAVRVAADAVAGSPHGAREVVVVSDLQETALSAGEPVAARVLVWEPPPLPPNRGIDSAAAEPTVWSPEGAVVAALGGSGGDPTAVRLGIGGVDVARTVAGAGDRVVLRAAPAARGWHTALVELDPDELRADDQWWLPVLVREPAAVRLEGGVGRFVVEAVRVLQSGGRVREGPGVRLGHRPGQGPAIVLPPADPSLVGAVNRALAARGVGWRLGELVDGEWFVDGAIGPAAGTAVSRRYRLDGEGTVVARADGEPWLVRAERLVLVASRMEPAWTELPVSAGFVPFLDLLINRLAGEQAWVLEARPGEVVNAPPGADRLLLPAGPVGLVGDRRVPVPAQPGVYFFRGAAEDTVGALAVNHDQRESRLSSAGPGAIRAALGPDTRVLGDRALDRELFAGARRADLTGLLIGAAVLAALLEMALATAGGRRREEV